MDQSGNNLDWFPLDTVEAAKKLIGCRLIRRAGSHCAEILITETEAYRGADDPASHAYRGPTPRSRIMFGPPGRVYVYFSYGMHHCMNIVTEPEGSAGAVLLRGASAVLGEDWIASNRAGAPRKNWLNGPGKLTQALHIDLSMNGYDLSDPDAYELQLLPGQPLPYEATPRIGISRGKELLWRFAAKMPASPHVR